MSEEQKKWDVYYSKPKDEPQPDDGQSYGEDIPISKKVHTDDEAQDEAPYTNDYEGDLGDGGGYANAFSRFWLKKKKRNLKLFLGIFFGLVLVFGGAIGVKFGMDWYRKLNKIEYTDGVNFENADQTEFHEEEEEDPTFTPMHDVADASSLKDWLKKWATNGGEKMQTKNVINCLLCGVDTEEGSDGRTDAMILVSVNKKTKKITLVSFMRDSYTYMNINGQDRWYKINASHNWGGPATLMETIENNYKVEIDHFITVDFTSFPKLIDALGGVEVDVEEYEARYIRRTSSHKHFPYGKNVKLNGDQALIYSRIRKSDADGDLSRTRRQRKLVTALMGKAKTASVGQLNNMLDLVLPFVTTNYRPAQLLSLGSQAIMQKWMNYEIEQVSCPLLDINEDGSVDLTGKDSYMMTGYGYAAEFVWIVDYQMDAQRVQKALYGTTNVEIHDNIRESPFDFLTGSNRRSSSGRSSSYDDEREYAEPVTEATPEEEPTWSGDNWFKPRNRDDDGESPSDPPNGFASDADDPPDYGDNSDPD